jgi:hypothetical protein
VPCKILDDKLVGSVIRDDRNFVSSTIVGFFALSSTLKMSGITI